MTNIFSWSLCWYPELADYLRDGLEIIFFSCVVYHTIMWLKKDRTKNLMPYISGYCLLAALAYLSGAHTMLFFLITAAPVASMLFILIHQETLQRNFITHKNITLHTPSPDREWLTLLTQMAIVAKSNNRPWGIIIELEDAIAPFIVTPHIVHAPVTHPLLSLVQKSTLYNPARLLWITHAGYLHALNSTWKPIHGASHSELDDALAYSYKTDAITVYQQLENHSFTLITRGTVIPCSTVEQTLRTLNSYVDISSHRHGKKGVPYHGTTPEKEHIKQRTL